MTPRLLSQIPKLTVPASLLALLLSEPLRGDPFETWDSNGDGKLTESEMPFPFSRSFYRLDTNEDGFVTREEQDASQARAKAKREKKLAKKPKQMNIPGYRKLADLPYASNTNPRQTLDLYLPETESSTPRPLLVFIHGGGWQAGDKGMAAGRLRAFADSGYALASIGYRLSLEGIWPTQIYDCKAAIRYLRGTAEQHGIDPDKMAVWGTSAGGHLAAMLGVSGGVEALEGKLGQHLDQSSRVLGVIDFYGPTLLSRSEKTESHTPVVRLLGGPASENAEKAESASPVTWVSDDDPPFLIIHGTEDPLVPHAQSTLLDKTLGEVGVSSSLMTVEGGDHGGNFPNQELHQAIMEFLEAVFSGSGPEASDRTVQAQGN